MRFILIILFFFSFFSALADTQEVCAKKYSELDLGAELAKLKVLLEPNKTIGLVNETKGSYIYLESKEDSFYITFLTTGFFDLYGIKREGDIVFCEKDSRLTAIGLDRTQDVFVSGQKLQFGDRSEKESFSWGSIPDFLAKKHDIKEPQVAVEP